MVFVSRIVLIDAFESSLLEKIVLTCDGFY
ncbi:hypothetical protein FBY04_102234 [Pseudomonas sp. SJZ080]|nr:hypothetical protein FBY04_102234 [Pseudomonas sp. SJZ080]